MPKGIYIRTKKHKENLSKSHLGKPTWNKGKKGWTVGTKAGFQKGHKDFVPIKSRKIAGIKSSKKLKGRWIGNGFKKGHKDFRTKEGIKRMSKKLKGSGSARWKGGINPINDTIRKSKKTREWRKKVFKRDSYTCQKYKIKGGKLHPHHIKNFSKYSKLRFMISNGITLSKKAHDEFHKRYGFKDNNKQQIIEFICKDKNAV